MYNEETIACEFGVYCSVSDNFPKYLVSLDEFDMSRNGIIVIFSVNIYARRHQKM